MDAKLELGELKRPLLEPHQETTPRYDSTSSATDGGADAHQNSKFSQMVNKVVGHKPHSIYFVEGANALSRESGILKSALEQVRKNALKSAKKRIKNKNAENSPSFCFYSGIDDGGDMGKFEELLDGLTSISTVTEFVRLPNESNTKYQFMSELFKKFSGPCLQIMVGDFQETAKLILADSRKYFEDDRPMLICTDDEEFYSTRNSLKNMGKFGKMIKDLCKEAKIVKEATKVCNCLKENAWKIDICNFPKKENLNTLVKCISLAICKGSNPSLPWLMDNSDEIANSLVQLHRKSKMLVFPNMWKFEGTEKKLNLTLFEENKRKSLPTGNMAFLTEEDLSGDNQTNVDIVDGKSNSDEDAKLIYARMKDRISIGNIKKYEDLFPIVENSEKEALISSHPVLRFRCALKKDDHRLARDVLSSQALNIYPYLYCNITNHWKDSTWQTKTKIIDHFTIENGWNDNSAISTLTEWVVEDIFVGDGRPNLKIATPIQGLMVNRLLYREFEFVKVLWRFEKKNALTNALLLWIVTNGIIEGRWKIFRRKHSIEDFEEFQSYIDDAIVKLLKSAEKRYSAAYDNPTLYKCPVFNQSRLIDVAGIVEHEHFFTQSLSRRTVAYMWSMEDEMEEVKNSQDKQENEKAEDQNTQGKQVKKKKKDKTSQKYSTKEREEKEDSSSPKVKQEQKGVTSEKKKIMYLVVYISVAYDTVRWETKERVVIQWITFVFVISLAVDEMRQAIGECGKKIRCISRWWSDPWNKWDLASMVLYFVAFSLPIKGSRYLFALFSFVWCLKFYQFLRKFKSVGTYIIIVQKMVPHFWNFGLVGLVPLIGYGIFVTSLLTNQYNVHSWNTFLDLVLRPYLLLFADTGIDKLKFSKKATLYGTPKIPVFFELMTILAMCAFMMFGGILLMNLLIAVFGGVYDEVKQKSECLWAINEFELLKEFKKKSQVPVPFSLPRNVWHIIKRLRKSERKQETISDEELLKSEKRQKQLMNDHLCNEERSVESNDRLKRKVVEEVNKRMKEIAEKHEKRFDSLQEQNNEMKQKLEDIISSLQLRQ